MSPVPYWTNNSEICNYKNNGIQVTFVKLPVGAPSAVSTLEQLIACGAKIFIGIGLAGSLQPIGTEKLGKRVSKIKDILLNNIQNILKNI
ncbi:hypothetical protein KM800_14175 [Clostridium tyrobutyricum]|uniref:hypothetical protein n=1 Tax=Clostridium tyrobutyricum TaxID=1519 RepID=UPI001C394583|nr:hypothetical protein [Clostridium tyrobutyricum]MBV4420454.1 hypothetical protein [Clostridium tyrobutyricum]